MALATPSGACERPVSRCAAYLAACSFALLGFAFVAAPHSCEWGLGAYVWAGAAAVPVEAVGTWALLHGRPAARRVGGGLLAAVLAVLVWLAGFAAADFKIICRLF